MHVTYMWYFVSIPGVLMGGTRHGWKETGSLLALDVLTRPYTDKCTRHRAYIGSKVGGSGCPIHF